MDYTPSEYAQTLAALLLDPDNTFRRRFDMQVRFIERLVKDIKVAEQDIINATQIIATTGKRTQRHIAAKQALQTSQKNLKRNQQYLAEEYADLTAHISTINPTPAGVGVPRPQTITDPVQIGNQFISDEERAVIEARINSAYLVLETFIPPTSANGQPTSLGVGPNGRFFFMIKPQLRRAHYIPSREKVVISESTSVSTITHEMLHHIENMNPTIDARIEAWYKTRTDPSKPGSQLERLDTLTGNTFYSPFEQTRPDEFAHVYIGRDYSQDKVSGSEVLSMFADYVLGQRSDFVREDPEWLQFCIDLLADPGSYQ
jgi:hypothetical protein